MCACTPIVAFVLHCRVCDAITMPFRIRAQSGSTDLFMYENENESAANTSASSAMDISMSGGFSHGATSGEQDDDYDVRHMTSNAGGKGLGEASM